MNRLFNLCKKSVMALVAVAVAGFAVVAFSNGKVAADEEPIKYVSLGDSMSTGFGYDDYYLGDYEDGNWESYIAKEEGGHNNVRGFLVESENAFPVKVRDLLANLYPERGAELTQLAGNAMRIDDIFGYLSEDYVADDFNNRVFGSEDLSSGENWNKYWANRAVALGKVSKQEDDLATLRKLFQDSVSEADLITLDAGYNNFGTFFTGRLGDLTGLTSVSVVPNYGDTDTLQDLLDDIECDLNVEEIYQMLRAYVVEYAEVDIDEYAEIDLGGITTIRVKDFLDLALHAFVSYCYYMAKTTDRILELNPDVKLVVLGLSNTQSDLQFSYNGQLLDLGGLYGYLVEAANLYTRALCPSSNSYYYVDTESLDVELLFDDLANDTLDADMYNRLSEAIGIDAKELSGETSVLYGAGLVAKNIFVASANVEVVNVEKLIGTLMTTNFNTLFADFSNVQALLSNPDTKEALEGAINVYIKVALCNGMWKHPSNEGHETIANAIVELVEPMFDGEFVKPSRYVAVEEVIELVKEKGPEHYAKYSPIIAAIALQHAMELNEEYQIDEHIQAKLDQINAELEFVVLPELERHLEEEVKPELARQQALLDEALQRAVQPLIRQYEAAVRQYEALVRQYEFAVAQVKAIIALVNDAHAKAVKTYYDVIQFSRDLKNSIDTLNYGLEQIHDESVAKVVASVQLVKEIASFVFADTYTEVFCDTKLLSLGDSSATGMGLDEQFNLPGWNAGYKKIVEGSYGKIIADDFGMEYQSLAMGGMRMQDLLYILDLDAEADDYFNGYILKDLCRYDLFIGSLDDMRAVENKKFSAAIADADIITVSLGGANFSTYAYAQLASLMTTGKLAYEIDLSKYADAPFAKDVLPALEAAKQLILASDNEKAPFAVAVMEAYIDAYFGACASVGATIDAIHEVNPYATVYVLGQANPLGKVEVAYEGFSLDLTGLFNHAVESMNGQYYAATLTRFNTQFVDVMGAETHAVIDENAPTNVLDPTLLGYISYNRGVFTHYNANGHAFIAQQIEQYLIAVECEFDEPTYEWSDDYSTVTATRVCFNDPDHTETETVNAVQVVTQEQDCTHPELSTFTAEFSNPAFETQVVEDVETKAALQHDYQFAEILWDGFEAKAVYTCARCNHYNQGAQTEIAQVISISDLTLDGKAVGDTIGLEAQTSYGYTQTAEHKSVILKFTYVANDATAAANKKDKGAQIYFAKDWEAFEKGGMIWMRYDKFFMQKQDKKYIEAKQIFTQTGEYDVEVGRLYIISGDNAGNYLVYARVDGQEIFKTIVSAENTSLSPYVFFTTSPGDFCKNVSTEGNEIENNEYDCEVTNAITTAPGCGYQGVRTYTATYDGHSSTKTDSVAALQHDYKFAEIVWDGFTAKAVYTCANCNDYKQGLETEVAQVISISDLTKDGNAVGEKVALEAQTVYGYTQTAEHKSVVLKFTFEVNNAEAAANKKETGAQIHFANGWEANNNGGMVWLRYDKVFLQKDKGDGYESSKQVFTQTGFYDIEVGKLYILSGDNAGKYLVYAKVNGKVVVSTIVSSMFDSPNIFFTKSVGDYFHDIDLTGYEVGYAEYACEVTSEVTTDPTCEVAGVRTYTASYDGHTDSSVTESVPAINHKWGEPTYTWSSKNQVCTATRVCENDSTHVETETVVAAGEVVQQQTCVLVELTRYTATFKNEAFATQVSEDTQTYKAMGHNWSNPVITKEATESANGEVTYSCTRCDAKNVVEYAYSKSDVSDKNTGASFEFSSNVLPTGSIFEVSSFSEGKLSRLNSNANIQLVGPNAEVVAAFEINVSYKGEKIQPNGNVLVTLPVKGVELGKYDQLTVVCVAEDGSIEKFVTKVNADGTVSFEASHFSTYAVVKTTNPTPVTDQAWFYIVIGVAVLAIAGAVVFVVLRKKKQSK